MQTWSFSKPTDNFLQIKCLENFPKFQIILLFALGKRCVVLFDYDPYRSSTSDHPERELKLREGDYITVFGEMDVDGYLEAEVDGELGHRDVFVCFL